MAANLNEILIAQLRDSYGRIIYTHKTHEKMADIYHCADRWLRNLQLFLSVLVTSGIIATVGTELSGNDTMWLKITSAIVSFLLVLLTTYMRNSNFAQLIQKHKDVAADIWLVRERYFCLLSDYEGGLATEQEVLKRREKQNDELSVIYKNAPRTTNMAYKAARKALKLNEEMTFSDEEIDAFLPKEMRKGIINDR